MVPLSNIQILRAFAATNVVVFHTIGVVEKSFAEVSILGRLAGWGENGVDIFFVLSGFVIQFSYANSPKEPGEFLRSRLIRIIPNYWSWTLALFFALLLLPQLFPRLEADLLHLLTSMAFVSGPLLAREPIFYVGWTLEYEMLFYFL
ncbi:acyltransferase, partial [Rhodobacteraceae bacterium R_SAG2]|nr:acyltransferase [Rhodobacteraceae bacterium R_SAG2]